MRAAMFVSECDQENSASGKLQINRLNLNFQLSDEFLSLVLIRNYVPVND